MDLNKELNAASVLLQNAFKAEIKRQNLVGTGKLLNSIKVKFNVSTDGNIKFTISAEDYFEYLDKKYNITTNVKNSSGFSLFTNELKRVYNLYLLEELTKLN